MPAQSPQRPLDGHARTDGAELMLRMQAGDESAFRELWRAYRRLVYTIALKMLGRPGVAEDITQSVFLKVWAKPAAFRGGSFGNWISRVTHNLAVDEVRRNAGPEFVDLDAETQSDVVLDELVFARLDAERLYESLRMISEHRRRLIELSFFEGRTHEEIAAITRLPLGTVKTRIRAGIGHLRIVLLASPAKCPLP